MDIIDIMLARAMTPQGQTDIYVNKANAAAAKAEQAKSDATDAVATVEAAAETIATTQEAAADLLEAAQAALETAQQAQIVMPEVYSTTGQNTDGYMTQKAVTDALNSVTVILNQKANSSDVTAALAQKVDNSTLNSYATTSYVTNAINNVVISGGGSNLNLGSENSGKIVIVNSNGTPIAGTITEAAIIEAMQNGMNGGGNGGYSAQDALGLEVDYSTKRFVRTQEATNLQMGGDFNQYIMYGGRKRCNVADDGTINAFYGDLSYRDDGSNGQVMVYQPKFYYQRIPGATVGNIVGRAITYDSFIVSSVAQNGFKVHPIFLDQNGEELDYVLFSAYEGGIYSASNNGYITNTSYNINFNYDKLSSVSGAKPMTGTNNLSLERAEQLARNRGTGWHMQTLMAESACQMLEIIEFGTMNGQMALGRGVCDIPSQGNYNLAALTGATASLGNNSGEASSTLLEYNGTTTTSTTPGKLSISYRGVENPWGNVWKMLNGVLINGNRVSAGGVPYICSNYNYSYNTINNNYENTNFSLPNNSNWISALGYGLENYDWVLMPAAAADSANSALPVGDNGWYTSNLETVHIVVHGGSWSFGDSCGPFYYGCDYAPANSGQKGYGCRLLYIPTKNTTYAANIAKWQEAN